MDFNQYQRAAQDFAVYPDNGAQTVNEVVYTTLGLNGEAGELADHVKKIIRDDHGEITNERQRALIRELGDCLWYVAMCASELGVTLADVASINIGKLTGRKVNDTLRGGDESRARRYEELLEGQAAGQVEL